MGGPRKCGTRWVSSISRDEGAGRSAASASQTTGFRVRILATHQGVNVGGVVPPVAAWGDESGVEHAGGGPPPQCLAMDAKARSSFAARDKHDCGHTAMKLHACDWCQARLMALCAFYGILTLMTQAPSMVWIPQADTFGARLALIRHRLRWNAKEAALACDLPAQSWREWELRDRLPRDFERVCKKISARTGVNQIWLMTGLELGPTNDDDPGIDPDYLERVRHQGLEPRTRWFGVLRAVDQAVELAPTG